MFYSHNCINWAEEQGKQNKNKKHLTKAQGYNKSKDFRDLPEVETEADRQIIYKTNVGEKD